MTRRLRTSPKWQVTLKRTRSPATIDRLLRYLMSNYSHVFLWASHQWLKLFPHTEIAQPVIQASGHWAISLVTYFITGLSRKEKSAVFRESDANTQLLPVLYSFSGKQPAVARPFSGLKKIPGGLAGWREGQLWGTLAPPAQDQGFESLAPTCWFIIITPVPGDPMSSSDLPRYQACA